MKIVAWAHNALRTWASGYLSKTSAASELKKAIAAAMSGNRYLGHQIASEQIERFIHNARESELQPLTFRHREVLQLLAEGRTMKEAAADLQIAARTIAFHKYSIMREYGLRTNFDLLRFAFRLGLAPRSRTGPMAMDPRI